MSDRKMTLKNIPVWTRPRSKMYEYNREFGVGKYQPMLEYVENRRNEGMFHSRPYHSVHVPDMSEVPTKGPSRASSLADIDYFLINSYKQQIHERVTKSVVANNAAIRGSKNSTELKPLLPATITRDHYIKQLSRMSSSK
eukprot:TRINITY_DN25596_c0_g1_i1.p1 TRINITY_DN25596_c0_g1~~TRINITY_DN25596_c0_g1_i1.p1  ORF type:complete len:140 (-),score=22.86 TRINITY_DN25596_c0_g1_i1:47-466(-)